MLRNTCQWVLRKVFPPRDKEEKHVLPATRQGAASAEASTVIVPTDENALIPARDKLLVFRSLTGIDTVPTISHSGHDTRAATNKGIYARVVEAESKASRSFRIYNIIVNLCLGTQLIVGAALTAIGAANGSRVAVTAFGAINTMTAGYLTYLKGSGMPKRVKAVQQKFKDVREHIEQREREFCLADCDMDPVAEAAIIEELYQEAKQDMDSAKSQWGQQAGRNGDRGEESKISSIVTQKLSKLVAPKDSNKAQCSEKI